MGITTIEWTRNEDGSPGRTANPIRARHKVTGKVGWHCVMTSPGCARCYAQTLNGRFGTKLPFTQRNEQDVELLLDLKPIEALRRVRKPSRVFLCDMTDLFQEAVPDEWIDQLFAMMAVLYKHTFQVLTKRSRRMREYFGSRTLADVYTSVLRTSEDEPAYNPSPLDYTRGVIRLLDTWEVRDGYQSAHPLPKAWPLPNVWLGCSVEDQKRADERIPDLLQVPAAVRFASYEPALGPVDFGRVSCTKELDSEGASYYDALNGYSYWPHGCEFGISGPSLDWIIVGGESGPKARTFDLAWARWTIEQCKESSCAVFMKQIGSNPCEASDHFSDMLRDKKGGSIEEWPEDLRIRQFPSGSTQPQQHSNA